MSKTRLALVFLTSTPCIAGAEDGVGLPIGFRRPLCPRGSCGTGERITVGNGTIFGADGSMTATDRIESPGEPNKVQATLLASGCGADRLASPVIRVESEGQRRVMVLDHPDASWTIWTWCE